MTGGPLKGGQPASKGGANAPPRPPPLKETLIGVPTKDESKYNYLDHVTHENNCNRVVILYINHDSMVAREQWEQCM